MAFESVVATAMQWGVSVANSVKEHFAKPDVKPAISAWVQKARDFDLDAFAAEVRGARHYDDYVWLMTYRTSDLDAARALLIEGSKLLDQNGTLQPAEFEQVRRAYTLLRHKRRQALRPILEQIEHTLPIIEGRLRQFPIDASLLAYGFMTLVGFVWLCGYYTALEVEVVPLLRDIRDVFLIGATSGLMPVAIFAGLTAAAFWPFVKIRRVAQMDTAASEELLAALQQARLLRTVRYWWWRCVLGLMVVANVSVLAGLYKEAHSTYDVAVIGGTAKEVPMRVLGSIGGFLVTAPAEVGAPAGVTIVPIADVKCLQRGHGTGACARTIASDDDGNAKDDLAVTISTALAVLREKDEWHTLVERVGQCRAMRTTSPAYFFSPVFDDDSAQLAAPTQIDFVRTHEGSLLRMIEAVTNGSRNRDRSTASINVIGFASGTSYPARNAQLATERARTIATALTQGIPALRSCGVSPPASGKASARAASCPIDIRAWGYGELPPLSWIGRQGDPSERVVLIAACHEDFR